VRSSSSLFPPTRPDQDTKSPGTNPQPVHGCQGDSGQCCSRDSVRRDHKKGFSATCYTWESIGEAPLTPTKRRRAMFSATAWTSGDKQAKQ